MLSALFAVFQATVGVPPRLGLFVTLITVPFKSPPVLPVEVKVMLSVPLVSAGARLMVAVDAPPPLTPPLVVAVVAVVTASEPPNVGLPEPVPSMNNPLIGELASAYAMDPLLLSCDPKPISVTNGSLLAAVSSTLFTTPR